MATAAIHESSTNFQQYQTMSQPVSNKSLSDPDVPAGNNGWDNANCDLIMRVNDVLGGVEGNRYVIRSLLGQGTFGQVVECTHINPSGESEAVAVKVIKNQTAYFQQARVEIGVLQLLNGRADPHDSHHIVRMRSFFVFREHLCLVFELLSVNLYELIKHNQFRGLSMNLLRLFMTQILDALAVLQEQGIIHCDLKPENVLLKGVETGDIKVIDFGSACLENQTVYSYIQSRFYRSPEVVLGHQYTMAIDMWSLGCVAAELFLGLPLFPGTSEHDLLSRIIDMLGVPPLSVLQGCSNTEKYFSITDTLLQTPQGPRVQPQVRLRSREEFEARTGAKAPAGKRYFKHQHLRDIIHEYPFRPGLTESELDGEKLLREALVDFLLGVLEMDAELRWTPGQALCHPFITGGPFNGPFQPPPDPRSASLRGESFTTAKLAAHVAGAASYTQTPSWNTLIGPASMSGRAHMLAQSPEGAHAAAHAAAVASFAAGFSPTSSLGVAGWGGLPSGGVPCYSMPLLNPQQQQQQALCQGGPQQQQQQQLLQAMPQYPPFQMSAAMAHYHQQQQQQQAGEIQMQQYGFQGGDDAMLSMMPHLRSDSFNELGGQQWPLSVHHSGSSGNLATGVGGDGSSLGHSQSLPKHGADFSSPSWLGGSSVPGSSQSLHPRSIGGTNVNTASIGAIRQQQSRGQQHHHHQQHLRQSSEGEMSEELMFGNEEGEPFGHRTGSGGNLRRLSSNLSGSMLGALGSRSCLAHIDEDGAPGPALEHHSAQLSWQVPGPDPYLSPMSSALPQQQLELQQQLSEQLLHHQQQQQQQQFVQQASLPQQEYPIAGHHHHQQQQQQQQQGKEYQQQSQILRFPQYATSRTATGHLGLDVRRPLVSAPFHQMQQQQQTQQLKQTQQQQQAQQQQTQQQLRWPSSSGQAAPSGSGSSLQGSSELRDSSQVAAAKQRFSCDFRVSM